MDISLRAKRATLFKYSFTLLCCHVSAWPQRWWFHFRWLSTVLCVLLLMHFSMSTRIAKNKHGTNTAIILFAQCPRYLYIFLRNRTQYVGKGNDAKNSAILSSFCYQKNPVKCSICVVSWKIVIECRIAFSEIRLSLENHSLEFHEIWHEKTVGNK